MGNKPIEKGRRPVHPGEILREDVLPALSMTIGQFAQAVGVTRKTMSMLINEKQGVSPAMAMRLSRALGNSARVWTNLQTSYDLWHAEVPIDIEPIAWKDVA
jgi:addiction module HigA family antidote